MSRRCEGLVKRPMSSTSDGRCSSPLVLRVNMLCWKMPVRFTASESGRVHSVNWSSHATDTTSLLCAGAATRDASNVTSFSAVSKLKMQLRVPVLRFSLPFASACNFPKAQLLELHGATSAAQLTLGQAAAAATRAQARAGANSLHIAFNRSCG